MIETKMASRKEAVNQSALTQCPNGYPKSTPARQQTKADPFHTIRSCDRQTSAWQVERGVYWVQTRLPAIAEKLKKIKGARLVAYSVAGGYLRTYEIARPLSWITRRYISPRSVEGSR